MLRRIKGVTLRGRVKSVDIRKELGVNSINEKVTEIRLRNAGGKTMRQTKREMGGLRPKGQAGTAVHPGGCPVQNILEVKNLGR